MQRRDRTPRKWFRAALVGPVAVLAVVTVIPTAQARVACDSRAHRGGDWTMPGHDLSGSRAQTHATADGPSALTPASAPSLAPAWSFNTGHAASTGSVEHPSADPSHVPNYADINSTPVEAGGCVYFGTAGSDPAAPANLFALDVATGRLAWSRHVEVRDPGLGGDIVGSPAVVGHRLYVLVNEVGDGADAGPYALALSRHTGNIIWRSRPFVTDVACPQDPAKPCAGAYTNASPIVANGVLIAGFSGSEGEPNSHGGFALIDARNGAVLAKTYTIPPSDWVAPAGMGCDGKPLTALPTTSPDPQHCGGGGIWTAPVADPASGYAYMGTGNPFSKKSEYKTTNAIIKVDIDRARPATFGRIVAYYKGDIDQSTTLLHDASDKTTCQLVPDDPLRDLPSQDPRQQTLQGGFGNSHGCLQLDLDFGAGANLFHQGGHLIVGDLQKSGVYHAVNADAIDPSTGQMTVAWKTMLGTSCNMCNAAATAFDVSRGAVYAAVAPGNVASTDDHGARRWITPFGDVLHYQGVSTANGVVYSIECNGFLDAVDAETGVPLLHRPLAPDGGEFFSFASAGPAVARDTVFVPAGTELIAYRPTASRAATAGVASPLEAH